MCFGYQMPIIPRVILGFEDFDLVIRCEDSENAPYPPIARQDCLEKKTAIRALIH